jgi:hypothetical protein
MKIGINYLSECMFPLESLSEIKRDLEEMKKYGFEAIRLSGDDLNWLLAIAKEAKRIDLEVWLGPQFHRRINPEEYQRALVEFAKTASKITDVFVIGNELSLQLKNFPVLKGHEWKDWQKFRNAFKERRLIFQEYLTSLAQAAKKHFAGPLTYASGMWERDGVNWSNMDIVSVNLYWWKYHKEFNGTEYDITLKNLKKMDKPVAITEFGFQTHNKAFEFGPAWLLLRKNSWEYNEEVQTVLLQRNLMILKKTGGVKIAFIHQWSEPNNAGFGLVRTNGTPKKALSLFPLKP